jgi:hypothetical protein
MRFEIKNIQKFLNTFSHCKYNGIKILRIIFFCSTIVLSCETIKHFNLIVQFILWLSGNA